MNIIFFAWKNSLNVFSKNYFITFLKKSINRALSSIFIFFQKFWIIFLADLFLVSNISRILKYFLLSTKSNSSLLKIQIVFLGSIFMFNSLLISAAQILVVIRSREGKYKWFKFDLINYFRLMIFGLLIFSILSSFASLFVQLRPIPLPGIFLIFMQQINLILILFWFESNFRFTDFFLSFEKCFNFFFYNMPFFILFALIALFSNYLFDGFYIKSNIGSFYLASNVSADSVQTIIDQLNISWFLLAKYLKFLFNFFAFSFIYQFFIEKQNDVYSRSIFELNDEELN